MVADRLFDILLAAKVLTADDMEHINAKTSKSEKNYLILKNVLQGPDWAYDAFIKALEMSEQPHLTQYLKTSAGPIADGGLCKWLAAELVDNEWQKLALLLGVPMLKIQQYLTKFQPNIFKVIIVTLLLWWTYSKLDRKDRLLQLRDALVKVKRNDLAEHVQHIIAGVAQIPSGEFSEEKAEESDDGLYCVDSDSRTIVRGLQVQKIPPLNVNSRPEDKSNESGLNSLGHQAESAQGKDIMVEDEAKLINPKPSEIQEEDVYEIPEPVLSAYEVKTMKILGDIICGDKYDVHDFRRYLNKFKQKVDLVKLRDETGRNLLQVIVIHNRTGFPEVLFDLGLWEKLSAKIIQANGAYKGLTAMGMVQKLCHTNLWEEFNQLAKYEKNMEPLHILSRAGDKNGVKEKLRQTNNSYTVNRPCANNLTPLYFATTAGNAEIIELLVGAGGDIYCKRDNGENLLMRATYLNHSHLISPLVKEYGLDPDERGPDRDTALHIAAKNGQMKSLKALLNVGVILDKTILQSACLGTNVSCLKGLIKGFGVDVNAVDQNGKVALHVAALHGKVRAFEVLLKRKADFFSVDLSGRNVLHYACKGGFSDMFKMVIKIADDKDYLEKLLNAQDYYTGSENIFVVRGSDRGQPGWHYVEVARDLMCLFKLKRRGGSMDVSYFGRVVKSDWGHSPPKEVVEDIEYKFSAVNISASDLRRDVTPLMLAILSNKYNVVNLILEKGPDLEIKDAFGHTAFHLACMMGLLNTVKQLILYGADTEARSNHNKTPFMLAEDNGHNTVLNYLKGRQYMRRANNFVNEDLGRAHRRCRQNYMEELHHRGADLKGYFIMILRDLTTDINQALYDLDTTPISGESEQT